MKQLLLILNPIAGTKKATKNLAEIVAAFNRADYSVQVYVTADGGDATEAVKQFGTTADLIVCCGGDGTLNETVNGLLKSEQNIPIGYIPAGSTNDFANTLHLTDDVLAAAQQIIDGTPHAYDVGTCAGKYFTYVASFGMFTKTSYNTPQNVKNTLGHMAYILGGIQELSTIRKEHLVIEIDGEVLEDDYLFGAVCNSVSIGGLINLKPDMVDMSDGKFEVLLIRAPKDVQELGECIIALTTQKYDCGMITFRSGSKVRVTSRENMTWSIDGERMDGETVFEIENLHQKIHVVH